MPGKTTDESRDYRAGHADAYDATAPLEPQFIEFLEDSAAVINARTEFKYRADFARFTEWLTAEDIPATLAALERRVLNRYVAWLKSRPAPPDGTARSRTTPSTPISAPCAPSRATWSATAASRVIPSTGRVRLVRTSVNVSSAPRPRPMSPPRAGYRRDRAALPA